MNPEQIVDIELPEVIQAIWEKALKEKGYDKDLYRKDFSGAWIARNEYGNTNSTFGWQIDHVYPQSKGGKNHFANLRPIQWKNNIEKGDSYPRYMSIVTSEDNKNVEKSVPCTVGKKLQETLKGIYHDIKD